MRWDEKELEKEYNSHKPYLAKRKIRIKSE